MSNSEAAAAPGGGSPGELIAEPAWAKVNLCLHVVGQRPDGYHRLESLVAFPRVGDWLEAEPADGLGLSIDGAFGLSLETGPDNLVMRAALALRAWAAAETGRAEAAFGAALRLSKRLPIASGIGGGSADAAAALRALCRLWGLAPPPEALRRIALGLGADVPVCLAGRTTMMRGIGEALEAAPEPPACGIVLVNPGAPISTPEAFGALLEKRNPPPPPLPARFTDVDALVGWLVETRNDLEPPVAGLRPVVAETRAALAGATACRLARMSGSGATCFGLFDTVAAAETAAEAVRAAHPGWWVASAPLGAADATAGSEDKI